MTSKSEFTTCRWKECPVDVYALRKYSVDTKDPRVATKDINDNSAKKYMQTHDYCTILGDTALPLGAVTSWNIRVRHISAEYAEGDGAYIGVAPLDVNQNEYNKKQGWFLECTTAASATGRELDRRKRIQAGDTVGVVMDMETGKLSFVLNGVGHGVVHKEIPLDKPLVPCVLLRYEGDSVELDVSEVKENLDTSITVPAKITAKSHTWDSITLTWKNPNTPKHTHTPAPGSTSPPLSPPPPPSIDKRTLYQVEVDDTTYWLEHGTDAFTETGLPPGTEHRLRVRGVHWRAVGPWSEALEVTTAPEVFEYGWWRKCPYIDWHMRYTVHAGNPRIAEKSTLGNHERCCTAVWNTALPANGVVSWHVRVLKTKDDNGKFVYIGVAPADIDAGCGDNFRKCGWYLHCHHSKLWSGPPHSYTGKEYGPRKGWGEKYVRAHDTVGVVVNMGAAEKHDGNQQDNQETGASGGGGTISFVLGGENPGTAYEDVPLDRPLVPCVVLGYSGDSVEVRNLRVGEDPVNLVSAPSGLRVTGSEWDAISLAWDAVEGAVTYQIDTDEGAFLDTTTTNTFTKGDLFPGTEHTFRVRAIREGAESEWSEAVKAATARNLPDFAKESAWMGCPDAVDKDRKYTVDPKNPRVAKKNTGKAYCTIVGNTPLPPNKVTSWSIKVLRSQNNDGESVFIGVAPLGIDQNRGDNWNKCGWYFDCHDSTLWSGPPQNYVNKTHGPRKEGGKYVHTGDSVGVVMDTTKGGLSFTLNGVNLGIGPEGIPLNKPLVPCILLYYAGDSIELIT